MRYQASISIENVAQGAGYPEEARTSLAAEIGTQLEAGHPGMTDDVVVTVRFRTTVVVDATVHGATPHEMTSPLEALSRLDASVLRALAVTGQFEEFDVVRRTLAARPA